MKLTKKQLINLIKENLGTWTDTTKNAQEGTTYTEKEILKVFNMFKKLGIEFKKGEQQLTGYYVAFTDIVKYQKLMELIRPGRPMKFYTTGPCDTYQAPNATGSHDFKKLFSKALNMPDFKFYVKIPIEDKGRIITGVNFKGNDDNWNPSQHPDISNSAKIPDINYNKNIWSGRFYKPGGAPFDELVIYDSKSSRITGAGETINICNLNISNFEDVEIKDLIKPRAKTKVTKPLGPDPLKDLSKSAVTSEPFEEDRLGPASIKLKPIEQYSTKTGQKGVLRTKEQIEATGKSLSDLRIGNFQIQKGGVNHYLVPIDYLDNLSDRELEIMLNPEFDLPDDLDL
tara:strand:+ start:285 stop:1310 length:1026 start_codon:yes stop_codon:yes gene_type:complete